MARNLKKNLHKRKDRLISKYIKQQSAGNTSSSVIFSKHFEDILRQAVSNTISLLIPLPLQHQAEDLSSHAGAHTGIVSQELQDPFS